MSAAKRDAATGADTVVRVECPPLGTIILHLGARLGTLDKLSRKIMAELLQQLVDAPDDAPEIVSIVNALAKVQTPMVRDAALHQALTRPDARAFVVSKAVRS